MIYLVVALLVVTGLYLHALSRTDSGSYVLEQYKEMVSVYWQGVKDFRNTLDELITEFKRDVVQPLKVGFVCIGNAFKAWGILLLVIVCPIVMIPVCLASAMLHTHTK